MIFSSETLNAVECSIPIIRLGTCAEQHVQVTLMDCHSKRFWKLTRTNIGLLVHAKCDGGDIFSELVPSMANLFRYSGGTHTPESDLSKIAVFRSIYKESSSIYSTHIPIIYLRKRRVSVL